MKATVVVFPGSNCDRDTAVALQSVTGTQPSLVWHRETALPPSDLIVLPGGFSFGDYLRAGAIAARSPIMQDVVRKARAGTPTLGICNGFQVLLETGLLPGVLRRNRDLQFVSKFVCIRVDNTDSCFTAGYRHEQVLDLPIAHMDGNYQAENPVLGQLEDAGRIAFRYCAADGQASDSANPNGSSHNIAGILNENHTILGLMPHPERAIDEELGATDGRGLFAGLVQAVAA